MESQWLLLLNLKSFTWPQPGEIKYRLNIFYIHMSGRFENEPSLSETWGHAKHTNIFHDHIKVFAVSVIFEVSF